MLRHQQSLLLPLSCHLLGFHRFGTILLGLSHCSQSCYTCCRLTDTSGAAICPTVTRIFTFQMLHSQRYLRVSSLSSIKRHCHGLVLVEIEFFQIPGFCWNQYRSGMSGKNSYQVPSAQICAAAGEGGCQETRGGKAA